MGHRRFRIISSIILAKCGEWMDSGWATSVILQKVNDLIIVIKHCGIAETNVSVRVQRNSRDVGIAKGGVWNGMLTCRDKMKTSAHRGPVYPRWVFLFYRTCISRLGERLGDSVIVAHFLQ
jgi:hypothetical protein